MPPNKFSWPESRNERTATAMDAIAAASDAELAAWPKNELKRADKIIAALERTTTAWDDERDHAGDELWKLNHDLLTDARALRAKLRIHLP